MSSFEWPAPVTGFISARGANSSNPDPAEAICFVCHKGRILKQVDSDGRWQPADVSTAESFEHAQRHVMGEIGNSLCLAFETSDPGDAEFVDMRAMLDSFDRTHFNLVGRALQLCDWFRTHRFCGKCGQQTVEDPRDSSLSCETCRLNFYPRLSPSIIVLIHRDDEVLLARNHLFPEGLYSTLAGFVEPGESIEETLHREVREEVGVNVHNLDYRGSQPWPFPNSLMLGFHAEYESGDIVLQPDEIADAQWFSIDALPKIPARFAISRWLIDDYLAQRGRPV
ncbi:MAG: NAD(+) diphosphatase [Proteobacteria bacterium]|nr:NAD(+) diphosphatase [Pseudomonadota bacterium]